MKIKNIAALMFFAILLSNINICADQKHINKNNQLVLITGTAGITAACCIAGTWYFTKLSKEKEIATKDKEVLDKSKIIINKEKEITDKEKTLAKKDTEIQTKIQEISDKDTELAKKTADLLNKDKLLAAKQQEITQTLQMLNDLSENGKYDVDKASKKIDQLREERNRVAEIFEKVKLKVLTPTGELDQEKLRQILLKAGMPAMYIGFAMDYCKSAVLDIFAD